jgi:putative nucleotidyltransferase with HDIG domain
MLSLERAYELLNEHVKSENLKKHSIASAAVLKALAPIINIPETDAEIIGLLHDLDFDITKNDPKNHGLLAADILSKEDFPSEYIHAIKSHNEETGVKRESNLDYALAAGETITGLIVATALVYPDKKISSVKVKSIKKRMKATAFARNVSRENILECEKFGCPLEDFIELSLNAMKHIEVA